MSPNPAYTLTATSHGSSYDIDPPQVGQTFTYMSSEDGLTIKTCRSGDFVSNAQASGYVARKAAPGDSEIQGTCEEDGGLCTWSYRLPKGGAWVAVPILLTALA
jgi:hypothetical protein